MTCSGISAAWLDAQATAARAVLGNLQAQKKANHDAIGAQTATVQSLQSTLGTIQDQVKPMDGTIALGWLRRLSLPVRRMHHRAGAPA